MGFHRGSVSTFFSGTPHGKSLKKTCQRQRARKINDYIFHLRRSCRMSDSLQENNIVESEIDLDI